MTYTIELKQTLRKTFVIEADNEESAVEQLVNHCYNIIDTDDDIETEIASVKVDK